MANILSAAEAATILRTDVTDPDLLFLLPLIDAHIKMATGRNWAADSTVRPEAKAAARILLVSWYENPAMSGQGITALSYGLTATMVQLEALALQLETASIPPETLALVGNFPAAGGIDIAIAVSPVLIFNHVMDASVTSCVALNDDSGNAVSSTITLDATSKIVTITPDSDLAPGDTYTIAISDAPDTFGQTLTGAISFTTAS